MDRLIRSPLLLEFSRPSVQHGRPGGSVKARAHTLRQKTSASMPTRPGIEERQKRRFEGQIRFNKKRDILPAQAKRSAEMTRSQTRPATTVQKQRNNPNAPSNRLKRRGNPQAPSKTEVRQSPSKVKQRPTLPKTPQFFSRTDARQGRF